MPTYSIVGVNVKDPNLFQEYVDGHKDTLTKYGGRFLVANNEFDVIEGTRFGQIVVVHEWPNRSAFYSWYNSDDYLPWKEIRFAAASANVVLVDGLPA